MLVSLLTQHFPPEQAFSADISFSNRSTIFNSHRFSEALLLAKMVLNYHV